MSNLNERLLWITNISKNARASDLKKLLSQFGKVKRAKILINAKFPGSCCFGYVAMASPDDANNVIATLNNTEFSGHIITIDKFENIKSNDLLQLQDDGAQISGDTSPEIKSEANDPKQSEPMADATKTNTVESNEPTEEKPPANAVPSTAQSASSSILTFHKIKEERERQKRRMRERALRDDVRRRHEECSKLTEMRHIAMEQRKEVKRLEYEREKLQLELHKFRREKDTLYHARSNNRISTSSQSLVPKHGRTRDSDGSRYYKSNKGFSLSQSTR